jgi:cation:H+ antiporter
MSPVAAIALFVAGLAVSVSSSLLLARSLDRVGARLGITDGLLGVLTALGADSPEISTAAVAVLAGHGDIGVGVVLGSNVFNLAGLLGLTAVIGGGMRVGRRAVLLEGCAALAVAGIAVLVVTRIVPGAAGLVLGVAVVVPYVWLVSLRPSEVIGANRGTVSVRLAAALAEEEFAARPDHRAPPASTIDALAILPGAVLVVGASVAMVRAADTIGERLSVSGAVMGVLVLAILTSIPNVLAAVRLGRHQRGAAVVSEAFNSNSANVILGLCLPATILGLKGSAGIGLLTAWWALGMTVVSVLLLYAERGLTRRAGWAIIGSYALFVVVVIAR